MEQTDDGGFDHLPTRLLDEDHAQGHLKAAVDPMHRPPVWLMGEMTGERG